MASKKAPKCPICGWATIPIVYGLPTSDDMDRTDIILGGCIVMETNPDIACSNCDWSGQRWHALAPLPASVWILMDPTELAPPIGLVAGSYDDVIEVFIFGFRSDIRSTKDYENWLSLVEDPIALTAPFGDLSPGLIAEFRLGQERFTRSDLASVGFQGLLRPPKFELEDPMGLNRLRG